MDHQARKEQFEQLHRDCEALEKVASQYPQGSAEYQAIFNAAVALHFSINEHPNAYQDFHNQFGAELTPTQIENLQRTGIDPDGEDDS